MRHGPACDDAVALVNSIACESCEVTVLDMNDANVVRDADCSFASATALMVDQPTDATDEEWNPTQS